MISGLIMTLTTWELRHSAREAKAFLLRRVKRIYPAYWIVTVPLFALWLVRPDLINSNQADPSQPLQSFLLLPQAGYPLLIVGWTLVYEMYFYVLFALALLAPRRFLGWIVGAWAAMTLVLALTVDAAAASPTLELLANPISLEFAAGVALGHLLMRRDTVAPGAILLAGVALFVAVVVIAEASGVRYVSNWLRVLGFAPACVLIVYGAVGLENSRGRLAPAWSQAIGDASYSIYLLHVIVLSAVGKAVAAVLPYELLHVPLLIAVPVLAVVVGMVFYRVVERPLLAALRTRRHLVPAPEPA